MPAVNVAMERSLRAGFLDLLAASLRPVFERRDIITNTEGQISSVATAFSSWDNCMQAAFCKWPVIALIAIAGLIVFSVVWCIVRCACCGLSCCCECFQCLKCCGDCCGCCDAPNKRHKHLDDSYLPSSKGYAPTEPYLPNPRMAPPPLSGEPQYAEFDVSKKGGEDALPAMPSWESAGSKKVMLEEDPVELEQLKKPENSGQNMPLMSGAGTSPGPASPSLTPDPYGARATTSPVPYGGAGHDMHAASGGYLSAGAAGADPYAQNDPYAQQADPYAQNERGYNQGPGQSPYGQSQSSLAPGQGYGAGVAGGPTGPGRRSPRDPNYNNGAYGGQGGPADPRYPGSRSPPGSYDEYGRARQGGYDDYAQGGGRNGGGQNGGQGQSYGMGPGRRSPPRGPGLNTMGGGAYPPDRARRSPVSPNAPQGGPNNMMGGGAYPPDRIRRSPGPPQQGPQQGGGRDYGYNGNGNNRPYPPAPQRQYSSDSTRPLRQPQPISRQQQQYPNDTGAPVSPASLNNNSGFDFNSGYSRPQTANDGSGGSGRPSTSQTDRGGGGGYPGYRPYKPGGSGGGGGQNAQDGWSGL